MSAPYRREMTIPDRVSTVEDHLHHPLLHGLRNMGVGDTDSCMVELPEAGTISDPRCHDTPKAPP
jgi:hypothetical protein